MHSSRLRRRAVIFLAALMLLTAGCDWIGYRANFAGSGSTLETGTLTTSNVKSIKKLWSASLAGVQCYTCGVSSPVVASSRAKFTT